jgi:hypothetical protein
MKNYNRMYMVVKPAGTDYIQLESQTVFSSQKGVELIRRSTPEATEIIALNEKAIRFLGFN